MKIRKRKGRYVIPKQKFEHIRDTKPEWVQPKHMTDELARQVVVGKKCGAKLSGVKFCTKVSYPGQGERYLPHRCAMHGGKSEITSYDREYKFRHGIYTNAILPGEEDVMDDIKKSSDLSQEIMILKLRLRRALDFEREQIEGANDFEVVMKTTRSGEDKIEITTTRAKPDHKKIVNSLVRSIVAMVAQQFQMQGGDDLTTNQKAQLARNALMEANRGVEGDDE